MKITLLLVVVVFHFLLSPMMTAFHTIPAKKRPRKSNRQIHQKTLSHFLTRRFLRTTMPRRRPTTAPPM